MPLDFTFDDFQRHGPVDPRKQELLSGLVEGLLATGFDQEQDVGLPTQFGMPGLLPFDDGLQEVEQPILLRFELGQIEPVSARMHEHSLRPTNDDQVKARMRQQAFIAVQFAVAAAATATITCARAPCSTASVAATTASAAIGSGRQGDTRRLALALAPPAGEVGGWARAVTVTGTGAEAGLIS